MENTHINKAIEKVGGISAMASLFDISPAAVSKWASTGKAPANRCIEIEKETGVTRYKLRPDVFGNK